jgi:ZIP family zinc transporter
MSTEKVLILGAIAGFTIFLGLPVGRARHLSMRTRAFLNALAIGILTFLLWDILGHAIEPVEGALTAAVDDKGSWMRFSGLSVTFIVGLGLGLLTLVYYDQWLARRKSAPDGLRIGPGAASVEEFAPSAPFGLTEAKRIALFIALGIGLHNFSEGLAIGQSAAKGEVNLALLLIIGFGLHNATEGFGIVAPMAAEEVRPSWAFLLAMGLIGGGPTFLGTVIGHSFVNETMFIAFLALAAGSILYVIVLLVQMAVKLAHKEVLMWGLFLGLLAGFATDFVLVAAGG